MESFEVWEMVAILFVVISPMFQSFVEFVLEIVFCFIHFFIMKNVDAMIDAFVPLFTYFCQFYITKTGIRNLRFLRLFGGNVVQKCCCCPTTTEQTESNTQTVPLLPASSTNIGQAALQPVSSSSPSVVQAISVVSPISTNTVKH